MIALTAGFFLGMAFTGAVVLVADRILKGRYE